MSRAIKRKEHQRLRWRLLYGLAEDDIRDRLIASVGSTRTAAWGPLDLTANPFLSVWSQAAASYRSEPKVTAPAGGEAIAEALADSGHWSLMQRVQRDTLALREMVVRIDMDEDGRPYTVPVPPYLVDVEVDPRNPYRALSLTEERPDPDDPRETVRVICDPSRRLYMAVDKDNRDVSERVLGGSMSGDAYPFVGVSGPLLPYVTYRAALTGSYWDPYTGRELVETSLQLAVLYSFYMHVCKDASWPQRYVVELDVAGEYHGTNADAQGIVTDPATLLKLRSTSPTDATGQVGQWSASSDPESVLRSIQAYERRAIDAALGTANVSRSNSDVRSGFSLAVSRDDQRELQRSYEPVFRRSDLELLSKVSALMGGPVDGWRIEYQSIPRDPAESRAEIDRLARAIETGLMSRVDAYMALHPQMSVEGAEAALAVIAETNARINAGA